MSVYPPSGSGGAHMDQSISGSNKKATPKKTPAKVVKKAAPAKKAATKALPPKKGK